jgi:hypothetical protein
MHSQSEIIILLCNIKAFLKVYKLYMFRFLQHIQVSKVARMARNG